MRGARRVKTLPAAIVIFAWLLCSACGDPIVTSGSSGSPTLASPADSADPDDADAIQRASEMEHELFATGLVVTDDPALATYLEAVARRLSPGRNYRIGVLRDPGVNAMALANGSIFVFAGAVGGFENEAQLAFLLCHEMAHIELRHAASAYRNFKARAVTAQFEDMALGGIATPLVRRTFAASLASYSREQEEEADRNALPRLAAAGYPAEEAERSFALTPDLETQHSGLQYASHPTTAARIEYLHALAAASGALVRGTSTNVERYRTATSRIALRSIEWAIGARLYERAASDAQRELVRGNKDARLYALLGEAHRMTAEDPDGAVLEAALRRGVAADASMMASYRSRATAERAQARDLFRQALIHEPTLSLAHRGLGLVARADGDLQTARRELGLYLNDPGPLPDRMFVEKLLEEKKQ